MIARHALKVTLSPRNGIVADVVCLEPERCSPEPDQAGCAFAEMWNWDSAYAEESYQGDERVLLEAPFARIDADEDGIEGWELEPRSDDSRPDHGR